MKTKICNLNLSDLNENILLKNFSSTWNIKTFESELKNENSKYIAIKNENELIGFAGITVQYDEAHIMTINVDKNYRKTGIGSILLEKLILMAKNLNLNALTLEVRNSNIPAQKLYEKYNFKIVGIRKNYYKLLNSSNLKEDAIIMTYNLK